MLAKDERDAGKASASQRRRLAYALAAGSAAGAGSSAEAIVVYSGIEDLTIAQGNYLPLLINADDVPDIYLRNYVDPYVGLTGNFQGAFLGFAPSRLVADRINNLGYVRALSAGYPVNPSTVDATTFVGSMAFGGNHPNAEFNNVENTYIGFSFADFPTFPIPIPDRELLYAWARVSINNAEGTFVLHDWAYETEPNVGIVTGDKGSAGDFNGDGTVDLADYTVWRDNLDTDFILAGNGDENGDSFDVVDEDDYTIWRSNFGHVSDVPPEAAGVPEAGSLGLLAAGALGLAALRERSGNPTAREARNRT
ncbi:MAG: hypothetical protein AAFV43_11830 [Planctomycetota bacterium]